MGRILRPEASSAWMLPQLASITPQYVQNVLVGALGGDHVSQHELFKLMEDTWPRLTKNLNELKRAVVALDWNLKPWSEDGEEVQDSAKERARLIGNAIRGMRPRPGWDEAGFSGMVYDILDAWGKGVSVLEIDWELRGKAESRKQKAEMGAGQYWAPRCTYFVEPRNYGWTTEGYLGLVLGASTQLTDGNGVYGDASSRRRQQATEFPPDKFLIAICKARSGHPLGGAMLRSLAWWWCASNFSADWLLNFAQVFGLPMRWANYDSGAAQTTVDAICNMLENMGSAGWAAFPAGTSMELKEPGKGAAGSLPQDNILDRADKQCDLIVLGQTLTSDVGASGSLALGDVHAGVRGEVIQAAANFVATVLNEQLVPAVCRLNYGDDEECPSYDPERDSEESSLAFKREVWKQFMSDGTVVDILANQVDIKALTKDVGLPVNEEYTDPYVPVADAAGNEVSGEVVKDSEGDIVGGAMKENPETEFEQEGTEGTEDGEGNPKAENRDPKAEATATPAPSTAPQTDVQATALNGAQVQALADLATQVATGQIPIETAKALATAAFPLVPTELIDRIFGPLSSFKPATSEAPATNQPGVAAADASGGFDQVASERLAAAVAEDLRPVMERLNAVLAIEDGPLMQSKLRLLLEEIDRLKGDVTRDPESARVIQEVLAAGFAEGISRKAESRK